MNAQIQEQSAFSEPTKTSSSNVIGLQVGTATRGDVVHYASFEAAKFPQPAGCVSISDHIARREEHPDRRALLAAARAELAEALYGGRETVATLRMKRGWSQQQLADAMGTSQPQVARIESGRLDPQLSTLRKLSNALACDMPTVIRALDNG